MVGSLEDAERNKWSKWMRADRDVMAVPIKVRQKKKGERKKSMMMAVARVADR